MLSARSISGTPSGAARYYAVGDYYSKGAEETSEWRGEGARRLGLAGGDRSDVTPRALEAILKGDFPEGENATWKRAGLEERKHFPGWDFTLSASKSVSVAAIIGADERLIEAHKAASHEAIRFLERYGGVRILENGSIVHRETGNLIVASFTEFWSREQEAQLHEHNVTANITFDGATDKWRAVDGRALFAALRAMGQVYQNHMAGAARDRLGYQIEWNLERGVVELVDVPAAIIDRESTRSKQIDAYAKEKGLEGVDGRERATLATRRDKPVTSNKDLTEKARRRVGPELARLEATISAARARAEDREPSPRNQREDCAVRKARAGAVARAVRFGLAHATAGEAVVEEADIIRHALQVGGADVQFKDVDAALARFTARGQLIKTAEQTGGKRLYHGRLLAKDLAAEERFARLLMIGKDTLEPVLKDETADRRLGAFRVRTSEAGARKFYPLSAEQHAAAKAFLTSRDRIHHVQGVGGAGKSAMVGAIRTATKLRPHLALAKTAAAAASLGMDAGVQWMTVDKFLAEGGRAIGQGGILYVDEASMLGTRAAARIDALAEKNHFRVVVIGDARQLPAIDQGKPHELAGRLGAEVKELKESRRHKTDSVKQAVAASRAGKIADSLKAIDRVHTRNLNDLASAIARDWHQSENRERSRILALDNKMRVAASEKARDLLIQDGSVEANGVKTKIHSVRVMTEAQKKIAQFYPVRDAAITFHLGSKRQGIEPGATFRIAGRTGDALTLTRDKLKAGRRRKESLEWRPGRSTIKGVVVYDIQQRELAKGDRIQWKRNEPALDEVRNGLEGKVLSLDGAKARIAFSDGKTRAIDVSEYPHWDHAYALTVYKAQGATYDRVFVAAPAKAGPLLNQQTFYTALSRARYAIDLYTNEPAALQKTLERAPGGKTSALEATGKLGRANPQSRGAPDAPLPPSGPPNGPAHGPVKGAANGRTQGEWLPLPPADALSFLRGIEERGDADRAREAARVRASVAARQERGAPGPADEARERRDAERELQPQSKVERERAAEAVKKIAREAERSQSKEISR